MKKLAIFFLFCLIISGCQIKERVVYKQELQLSHSGFGISGNSSNSLPEQDMAVNESGFLTVNNGLWQFLPKNRQFAPGKINLNFTAQSLCSGSFGAMFCDPNFLVADKNVQIIGVLNKNELRVDKLIYVNEKK